MFFSGEKIKGSIIITTEEAGMSEDDLLIFFKHCENFDLLLERVERVHRIMDKLKKSGNAVLTIVRSSDG